MLSTGAIVAIAAAIIVLVVTIVIVLACKGQSGTQDNSDDGGNSSGNEKTSSNDSSNSLVCEQRHLNYAWGYQNKGMYVDNAGRVYRFDASDRQPFVNKQISGATKDDGGGITFATLKADRFDKKRTLVKTLTPEELQSFRDMFAQVENENRGLGEKISGAYDYGLVNTTCYKGGDKDDNPLQVYELDLDGDTVRRAVGENAQNLAVWLRQLDRSTSAQASEEDK